MPLDGFVAVGIAVRIAVGIVLEHADPADNGWHRELLRCLHGGGRHRCRFVVVVSSIAIAIVVVVVSSSSSSSSSSVEMCTSIDAIVVVVVVFIVIVIVIVVVVVVWQQQNGFCFRIRPGFSPPGSLEDFRLC